ncbi:DUF861 domain-containing protein [Rhizobium sp. ARZ01]|uniref:cupin domain-containing protein n=1 Tax=Rhizobium sp. ARZ01 TaxID=2769313 RepID=UPI00177E8136|nr:cupin domain-containing protein [Rhizobium sp. ARZ01]MBD9375411.1 DUF861 domain-containing protein [Rhizobium sp. ARZ01]
MQKTENPKLVEPSALSYSEENELPAGLMSGNQMCEIWSGEPLQGNAGAHYGIWLGQPGFINISRYPADELFTVLEGHIRLDSPDGEILDVKSGQTCLVPRNWRGVWNTMEITRKIFVTMLSAEEA